MLTPARPARLGYQPGLDRVRAVCVVGVLVTHLLGNRAWAKPGQLGVDGFFVLSGFLITTVLLEEHTATGQISLRSFYLRRGARLFPALFTMVLVAAPLCAAFWFEGLGDWPTSLIYVLVYAGNWTIALLTHPLGAFTHTWSLAVEEQFYLLWPPILVWALSRRRTDLRVVAFGLTMMITTADLWRGWLALHGATSQRLVYGSDVRADELLIGCLGAVLRHGALLPALNSRISSKLVWVGVGLIAVLASVVWPHHLTMMLIGRPVFSVATLFVILGLISNDRPPTTPHRDPIVVLGRISYGVYLWHFPIFMLLDHHATGAWGIAAFVATSSIALAAISYYRFELPIQRWARSLLGGEGSGLSVSRAG